MLPKTRLLAFVSSPTLISILHFRLHSLFQQNCIFSIEKPFPVVTVYLFFFLNLYFFFQTFFYWDKKKPEPPTFFLSFAWSKKKYWCDWRINQLGKEHILWWWKCFEFDFRESNPIPAINKGCTRLHIPRKRSTFSVLHFKTFYLAESVINETKVFDLVYVLMREINFELC